MRAAWRAMRLWNGHLKVTSGGAQQGKEPGSEILFFGTDDLSGRCKTRQDGKLTDEVVSCKKTKSRRPCSFQRSFTRSEHIACGFCAQDSPVAAETATPTVELITAPTDRLEALHFGEITQIMPWKVMRPSRSSQWATPPSSQRRTWHPKRETSAASPPRPPKDLSCSRSRRDTERSRCLSCEDRVAKGDEPSA